MFEEDLDCCTNTYHVEEMSMHKFPKDKIMDKICAETSTKFYPYEFVCNLFSAL